MTTNTLATKQGKSRVILSQPSRRGQRFITAALAVSLIVVAAPTAVWTAHTEPRAPRSPALLSEQKETGEEPPAALSTGAPLKSIETAALISEGIRWVVKQVSPAIVSVRGAKSCTGFFFDPNGYILTVSSAVGNADSVHVTAGFPGKAYTGRIIASDADSDLCVIKVDGKDFPYIKLGDSDASKIGDFLLAFANPPGGAPIATFGIVSYKNRPRKGTNIPLLQISAPISPDNPGGPVVNADIEVVGVSLTIMGNSFIGIAYAVPINAFKERLLPKLGKRQ